MSLKKGAIMITKKNKCIVTRIACITVTNESFLENSNPEIKSYIKEYISDFKSNEDYWKELSSFYDEKYGICTRICNSDGDIKTIYRTVMPEVGTNTIYTVEKKDNAYIVKLDDFQLVSSIHTTILQAYIDVLELLSVMKPYI